MSDHCKRAIKILEQYERLTRKLGIKLSARRIAHLNRLRDAGTIKSTDLHATLTIEFPGEFVGMTLEAIRQACATRGEVRTMSVHTELNRLSFAELRAAFMDPKLAQAHADESELWLEEIAYEIAQTGGEGIQFLLASIPTADSTHLHAILLGLSSIRSKLSPSRRSEIWNVAQRLLHDDRYAVVARAVEVLLYLGCKTARKAVLRLQNHSSPYVVGSVLRYMSRHFPREAIPMLEKALASDEPIIRQNGIDELDELNYVNALPAIRRLIRDKDRDVRQAARTAVKNLQPSRPAPRVGKSPRRVAART